MLRSYLLLLLTTLAFAGCKNNLETVTEKNEFGYEVTYQKNRETGEREGPYTVTNAEGLLMETSNYKGDTLHGERRLYSQTGELETLENYENGVFQGIYQSFYKNEQVKFEANYSDGILAGETKVYYEDGQLKEVVFFKNNEENGPFTEYHPNGKIKAKGSYFGGVNSEHGPLELYDENGDLIKKMNCEKGVCRTSWTKEDGDVNTKKI